jgi:hypothetical protein
MDNQYNSGSKKYITQANQTQANILANPQKCRIFIANDTRKVIAFDKDLNPIICSTGECSETGNFYTTGFDEVIAADGTYDLITMPLPSAGYGQALTGWINICFTDSQYAQTTYFNRANFTYHLESGQYSQYLTINEMTPDEKLAVGDVAGMVCMLIQPAVNLDPTFQTGYFTIKNNTVVSVEIFGTINYGLMTVTL